MSNLLVAPMEVLVDSRLSSPERQVLFSLFSFRGKETNTVWPSVKSLAARSLILDHTRISKITKSLSEKGWLTKKRRGFTGGNIYTLKVPEFAINELEQASKLDSESNLDGNTNTNLDSGTNTNLDSDTKYKEQTIEHTIEHKQKSDVGEKIKFAEIRKIYNQTLGDLLGQCRSITGQRERQIRARVREDQRRSEISWWEDYFLFVTECPFLIGKTEKQKTGEERWLASFDWLVNENNMIKVIEGKYERI